ncbi:uncharacterized protein UHOD_12182 [Ustilago sp. UG-2017b]|nr:uncharacterized protein UHOD_12182 [Ustilago sp. UG-2017b]
MGELEKKVSIAEGDVRADRRVSHARNGTKLSKEGTELKSTRWVTTQVYHITVMGRNAQEARGSLVHMEGAQVSGEQTDRRGEAVDLAGTGSKHGRSTVSMETMDEEACITNSHAKKDQAHMQGGLSAYARRAKRICEEGQAPPRGGPSSRSMQTHATQGFER